MATVIEIAIEPLTRESFAPYGQLIAAGDGAPDYARPTLDVWHLDYASDAPFRIQIMRYSHKPMVFSRLERHQCVTEGRVPLNGARSVLAVAGATARDSLAAPDSGTLRAFLLDGSAGLMFKPGVWHSLDCFPLEPPHADYALMSDVATETEIEAGGSEAPDARTNVVDYASQGIEFHIADVNGLISNALPTG